MDDELFGQLTASVKEAGKIKRGEAQPSRKFEWEEVDVAGLRNDLGKSQAEFASMLKVSVSTLRNWEQGRRRPRGPARALLLVTRKNPAIVEKALRSLD